MNITELKDKLIELAIPKDSYCFEGGLPNESYCIIKIDNEWEVYYSERGIKSNKQIFKDEDTACDYFLNILTKAFL